MPNRKVIARARKDARQGKSRSTQAGEFVREEMQHIRRGKHGARNTKQAIAIGLSEARRAGVKLPTRGRKPAMESATPSRSRTKPSMPSARRSRAALGALKREGRSAASPMAISRQTRQAAAKSSPASRSFSARKAVQTKGPSRIQSAARKAARTRASA